MNKTIGVHWNLNDILKIEDFKKLYGEIEKEIGKIDEYWRMLSPKMSEAEFVEFIEWDEKYGTKLSRLGYLPALIETTNQKDQEAKKMKSQVDDLSLKISEKSTRVGLWFKGLIANDNGEKLDDENARRLFKTIPDLEYGLSYGRLAAKHTLSEKEEKIIDNKDSNGVGAIKDLRTMIETEMEFDFEPKGQKKRKIKTQAELMVYVYSHKAEERKAAYVALLKKHKENADKFFLIYQSVVKDWDYEARLRGYKSPISVMNFANHVPDKAIEKLLEVCKENREIFYRYFRFKAKELGQKKLSRFDIYAPLEKIEKKANYEESIDLVVETYQQFSVSFGDRARKIVEEKHIDSHPDKNKEGGAFCATVDPSITPYVMLNFAGKLRDIFTMAHELGHGIHSLFANKHYPSSQHSSLPLAETASTFGEMILFEKMYLREENIKIKKAMLSDKMADTYATILRQNYFVMFEIEAHRLIARGTTTDELSALWLKMLKDQFGEWVEVDKLFAHEWTYIPHIVNSPFYCYAYNFGELLSYSLFDRYKKEGKKFIPVIERLLEAGGSKDPNKLLLEAGIDINSKSFWQGSFELIKNWQNELDSLS